jgi:hypothetical protein
MRLHRNILQIRSSEYVFVQEEYLQHALEGRILYASHQNASVSIRGIVTPEAEMITHGPQLIFYVWTITYIAHPVPSAVVAFYTYFAISHKSDELVFVTFKQYKLYAMH